MNTCTWVPACSRRALHHVARQLPSGVVLKDAVCDGHLESARCVGYRVKEPGDRRASPGSALTRDLPTG